MRKLLMSLLMFVGIAGVANAQPFCPGVAPWVFTDVQASDSFCTYVTWMAQNNVTLGCQTIDANNRLYCPDDLVTRKQMAAFMNRQADAVMPLTCAAGQVMKWSGTAWACANDATGGGSGTVTSVLAGTGLQASPNPIVGVGSINLAPSYQLPQVCTNGQVAKWNGSAWACGNDIDTDTNSGGTVIQVATGPGLTGGPINTSGTIGIDSTYLQRRVAATCTAGSSIRAISESGAVTCEIDDTGVAVNAFAQNGNSFGVDAVLGTTDNNALDIRVNDTRVMRYQPDAISPNVIGGHLGNYVGVDVRGATIAGGGVAVNGEPAWNFEGPNRVTDIYGSIGGGYNNQAGDNAGPITDAAFAVVGGGWGNVSGGNSSVVAGGDHNGVYVGMGTVGGGNNNYVTSTGYAGTVAGGRRNYAQGYYSTIPGGFWNTAAADYSFAAGFNAKANHPGAFVWSDFNFFDFTSSANNEFAVRATGGMRVALAIDAITGLPTWTCSVVSGGSWACSSDRNLKQNLRKLEGQEVLSRVASMPIYAWNPKGQNSHLLHYGPTAQDFHAAFGLGDSPLRIAQQDADGVALAAIQGVNEKLDQREAALRREIDAKTAEVAELKRQIAELRSAQQAEVAELRRAVEILMARTAAEGQLAAAR
jgi:hypothetical protein